MNKYNSIFIVVLVVVVAFTTFYLFSNQNKEQEILEYTNTIDRLQVINDSLKIKNKLLDISLQKLTVKADSLQALMQQKRNTIKQLKQIRYEKINAIKHYNNDKLYQFFSNINTNSTTAQ